MFINKNNSKKEGLIQNKENSLSAATREEKKYNKHKMEKNTNSSHSFIHLCKQPHSIYIYHHI